MDPTCTVKESINYFIYLVVCGAWFKPMEDQDNQHKTSQPQPDFEPDF